MDETKPSRALEDVAAERRRQIEVERYTPEHDNEHTSGEIARAGASYALHAANVLDAAAALPYLIAPPDCWPWHPDYWKPRTPRYDLVRAAALLIAEIERLDRLTPNT